MLVCRAVSALGISGNIHPAIGRSILMIELNQVSKSFHDGESELQVLQCIDLKLEAGHSLALLGASGSGKSTLLQVAAGLDEPDEGEVRMLGQLLTALSERDLALFRRKHLGFVFQQFNLLPGLNVQDNLLFQRRLNRMPDRDAWVDDLIAELELGDILQRAVEVLSGGQQQRVAIGRALAHAPELVFADEPTGNLHDSLSRQVMRMFARLVEESGSALLMVTHNRDMASFTQRRQLLKEGHLHVVDANPV